MHTRNTLRAALVAAAFSAYVLVASASRLKRGFVPCESLYNAHASGTEMSTQDVRDWIRYACYVFFPSGIGAEGTAATKQSSTSGQTILLTSTAHTECGADSQCSPGYCWMCPAGGWNCGTDGTSCGTNAQVTSVGGKVSGGSMGGTSQSDHDQCGADSQCATGRSCWICPSNGYNCGTDGVTACQWSGLVYSVGGKKSGGSTGGTTLSTHDKCGFSSQCASGYSCWKCLSNGWNCGKDGHTACQTTGSVTSVDGTVTAASPVPVAAVAQGAVTTPSSSGSTVFDGSLTWYSGDTTTSCYGSNTLKDSDLVVAISHSQSPNAWCGKKICMKYVKSTSTKYVTVTAKDTCPDSQCVIGHLDATLGVWAALGIDLNIGKINKGQGLTWWEGSC